MLKSLFAEPYPTEAGFTDIILAIHTTFRALNDSFDHCSYRNKQYL